MRKWWRNSFQVLYASMTFVSPDNFDAIGPYFKWECYSLVCVRVCLLSMHMKIRQWLLRQLLLHYTCTHTLCVSAHSKIICWLARDANEGIHRAAQVKSVGEQRNTHSLTQCTVRTIVTTTEAVMLNSTQSCYHRCAAAEKALSFFSCWQQKCFYNHEIKCVPYMPMVFDWRLLYKGTSNTNSLCSVHIKPSIKFNKYVIYLDRTKKYVGAEPRAKGPCYYDTVVGAERIVLCICIANRNSIKCSAIIQFRYRHTSVMARERDIVLSFLLSDHLHVR